MALFEQKYCIGSNDGEYQIIWDISALIKDLPNDKFTVKHYKVADLIEINNFFGNAEYAMKTDMEIPCIMVKLNENIEKLIDGNHRLYKAKQLNLDSIQCYVLPEEYHKRFIIDYDFNVYEKVIASFIK